MQTALELPTQLNANEFGFLLHSAELQTRVEALKFADETVALDNVQQSHAFRLTNTPKKPGSETAFSQFSPSL